MSTSATVVASLADALAAAVVSSSPATPEGGEPCRYCGTPEASHKRDAEDCSHWVAAPSPASPAETRGFTGEEVAEAYAKGWDAGQQSLAASPAPSLPGEVEER